MEGVPLPRVLGPLTRANLGRTLLLPSKSMKRVWGQRSLAHILQLGSDYQTIGVFGQRAGLQANHALAGDGLRDLHFVWLGDEFPVDLVGVARAVSIDKKDLVSVVQLGEVVEKQMTPRVRVAFAVAEYVDVGLPLPGEVRAPEVHRSFAQEGILFSDGSGVDGYVLDALHLGDGKLEPLLLGRGRLEWLILGCIVWLLLGDRRLERLLFRGGIENLFGGELGRRSRRVRAEQDVAQEAKKPSDDHQGPPRGACDVHAFGPTSFRTSLHLGCLVVGFTHPPRQAKREVWPRVSGFAIERKNCREISEASEPRLCRMLHPDFAEF